ncbi:MAG: porin family protein [Campylobacterota bacterium]|nr:porin family protein [Campylobacterota bacterium]
MFKNTIITAVTTYLLISSSLCADSDYYGKIGVSYAGDKIVEGTDYKTRNYTFNKGVGAQIAVGYDLEIMSIEGEYTYSTADMKSVELLDESRSVDISGYQDIHSLMVNALYHPVMNEKFSPYIGFGLGFSSVLYESANIDVEDSALTLTSQFMLGSSYKILDDIELNIELRHKMLQSYDISGIGEVNSDNYNELFFALVYRFTP